MLPGQGREVSSISQGLNDGVLVLVRSPIALRLPCWEETPTTGRGRIESGSGPQPSSHPEPLGHHGTEANLPGLVSFPGMEWRGCSNRAWDTIIYPFSLQ